MNKSTFLVDGHVHFHDIFDERKFLDSVFSNLKKLGEGWPTILLTEIGEENVFEKWKHGEGPWPSVSLDDENSILLDNRLLVIKGRQLVSLERIEVLGLYYGGINDNEKPIEEIIDTILASGGIPVIPWGVGKWFGNRGAIIKDILSKQKVILGDNAGRPPFWPAPKIFRNSVVLPGTDPLPLPSHVSRVGQYGFRVTGKPGDIASAGSRLRDAIDQLDTSPSAIGNRSGLVKSITDQISLRFVK